MSLKYLLPLLFTGLVSGALAQSIITNSVSDGGPSDSVITTFKIQRWNLHAQSTCIIQGDRGFHAKYSGPNSLTSTGEVRETITANLFAGTRLWKGAEAHMDFLVWQGFGLSQTYGIGIS